MVYPGMAPLIYSKAIYDGAETRMYLTPLDGGTTIGPEDIESSGIQLTDIMNGDERLLPGKAVMKELNVSLLNTENVQGFNWTGEFTLDVETVINSRWVRATIGHFRGTRPEKIHYVDVIDFTAHDLMQNFDIPVQPFFDSVTLPITFSALLSGLCQYCGVENATSQYAMTAVQNRQFSSLFSGDGLTCRDVLALMAEATACYAKISYDGKLRMTWFKANGTRIEDDMQFSIDTMDFPSGKTWGDMEAYTWEEASAFTWEYLGGYQEKFRINGVNVRQTEDDIGVTYGGLTGNVYTIVDNPFLAIVDDSDPETYIKPIYEKVTALKYLPMSVECVGNPLLETGDKITVSVRGEDIQFPIFSRTMRWNGAFRDAYEATGSLEKQAFSTGVRQKLTQGARFHEFRVDIDSLVSRIGNAEGDINTLEQTSERTLSRLSNAEGDINTLEQTSERTLSRLSNAEGDINTLEQTSVQTLSRLSNAEQDIATIDQRAGAIEIEVAGKYDKVSGIDITSSGIDISGSQYVKIASGGQFDVESTNFAISSEDKKMVCGNWTFDGNGSSLETTMGSESKPEPVTYFFGKNIEDIDADNKVAGIDFWQTSISGGWPTKTYYYPAIRIFGGSPSSIYSLPITFGPFAYVGIGYDPYLFLPGSSSVQDIRVFANEVVPNGDEKYLGDLAHQWDEGYIKTLISTTGSFQTVKANYLQQLSSRDVKHDIRPLADVGGTLDKLQPVSFVYNSDELGRKRFGLIQEDTKEVLPEICMGGQEDKPEDRSINYMDLVPLLLKEVQDLRKRVADLETRVGELERR